MEIPKIHEGEYRFCLILWEHGSIAAAQLARLCQEQLGWKRTTTYTVIKRLGERGVLKNEDGMVTALVSKDEAQAWEIDELVEKKFEGSPRLSPPLLDVRISPMMSSTRCSR